MLLTSVSLRERLRLQDLYDSAILDTEPEQDFNDLAILAAQIYQCPYAAITFIDEKRQWLKAKVGFTTTETTRADSFCTYTIESPEVMIVPDATADNRFKSNPYVTGDPFLRFYAGAPILSASGQRLGSICVLDDIPRKLSEEQTQALKIISAQITKLMLLRKVTHHLTQLEVDKRKMYTDVITETVVSQQKNARSISSELHENIAQGLAATKFFLESAREQPAPALLEKCIANIDTLIEATRSLSRKTYPTTLATQGLQDLLEQLLNRFSEDSSIATKLRVENEGAIPSDLQLSIYSMVEEQLENVREHAFATEVSVLVRRDPEALYLSIRDNGIGIDEDRLRKKTGLNKIAMLCEFFHGTAGIEHPTEGGCMLFLTIPLAYPAAPGETRGQGVPIRTIFDRKAYA